MMCFNRTANSGGKFRQPRWIDQPDADHVLDVNLIFPSVRHQLHQDQGLESDHAEVGRIVDGLNLRRRQEMIGSSLFPGEQEVDCLARLTLRARRGT